MHPLDYYKKLHGAEDDDIVCAADGAIELPRWLWHFLLDRSGIQSRKLRHVRKAVKRQLHEALRRGLDAVK